MIRRLVSALVCAVVSVTAIAADLPTCTTGMAPYRVEYSSGYTGLTPSEACAAAGNGFAASTGTGVNYSLVRPDGLCQLYYEGDSGNRFPITHVCEPAGGDEPEEPGTGDQLSAAFIAKILATYFGIWALGFGVGKGVAWTRALGSVG